MYVRLQIEPKKHFMYSSIQTFCCVLNQEPIKTTCWVSGEGSTISFYSAVCFGNGMLIVFLLTSICQSTIVWKILIIQFCVVFHWNYDSLCSDQLQKHKCNKIYIKKGIPYLNKFHIILHHAFVCAAARVLSA